MPHMNENAIVGVSRTKLLERKSKLQIVLDYMELGIVAASQRHKVANSTIYYHVKSCKGRTVGDLRKELEELSK